MRLLARLIRAPFVLIGGLIRLLRYLLAVLFGLLGNPLMLFGGMALAIYAGVQNPYMGPAWYGLFFGWIALNRVMWWLAPHLWPKRRAQPPVLPEPPKEVVAHPALPSPRPTAVSPPQPVHTVIRKTVIEPSQPPRPAASRATVLPGPARTSPTEAETVGRLPTELQQLMQQREQG